MIICTPMIFDAQHQLCATAVDGGTKLARGVADRGRSRPGGGRFARLPPGDYRGLEETGLIMLNMAALDELARKIGRVIESSPARDIEKNVKALLQGGLQRLDLVPREEFEIQAQVLARSREKLEALEARVAELEARLAGRARGP
jgi:BMFP domain-containing protein YqiC